MKNKAFSFAVIFIVIIGLTSIICLQINIMGHSQPDNNISFLNNNDNAINFADGINFIYETQLIRVHTVEKWVTPIKIRYEGNPTKEDIDILNQITKDFNKINGFPGMKIVNKDENVLLIYAPEEDLSEIQQEYNLTIDNGSCQRFSENGEIIRAVIIIESDIDQDLKNSVVLHEIFHMIGFYGHSFSNISVINQIGEPVSRLSAVDTLSFKMLYHPEIPIGMDHHEMDAYYQDKEIDEFLEW